MNKIAVVAIAYNRPKSLIRLLNSLNESVYDKCNSVPLIISIDWSEKIELVYKVAEEFEWKHGPKKIITHDKNLGLKRHVMFCGDLTEEYEAVAVFEDDIYVSPGYYQYGMRALEYYESAENIVGISLYTPEWNQTAERFFYVEQNQYDTFFMQYAQSWGQIWTKKWWREFNQWLEKENDKNFNKKEIPPNVQKWPENSSWLRDHIKFCIEKDKYFVYSKVSYSTNFSEAGEHNMFSTPSFQVPICNGYNLDYDFQPVCDNSIAYDAFFEREGLSRYLNISEDELCIDLYGTKINNKRYLLTTRILDKKVVKSFGMKLRPPELNVIKNIEGQEIHLYDTYETKSTELKKKDEYANIYRTLYDVRATRRKDLMLLNFHYLKSAILNRIKMFKK